MTESENTLAEEKHSVKRRIRFLEAWKRFSKIKAVKTITGVGAGSIFDPLGVIAEPAEKHRPTSWSKETGISKKKFCNRMLAPN